ncbi:glycosyltransferase family 4 protein [Novosphingobium sp. PASSN1]|uniref:glycosyltransferase family 4 protein n=1 Tax=Novosphingobium sp. PASSN1 TaxID=2015561 RepID=UPI0025E3773A|nr:glycosyltransferase family 4 protein [Novosphingobium sp. PASSN1]
MKILHVSEVTVGGIATYFEEIIPAQVAALGQGNVLFLVRSSFARRMPEFGLATLFTYRSEERDLGSLWRMLQSYRAVLREHRPDVVHLHSTFAGWVVRAYHMVSFRRRPRIVYCAHGWPFLMENGKLARWLSRRIERVLYHACDRIITISKYEDTEARQIGIKGDKMLMIYNGISAAVPDAGASADETATDLADSSLNLLFVGRLDPQKGFDLLETAMQSVRRQDICLHAIGSKIMASKATRAAGATSSAILFHGWLPRPAVLAYMRKCDAVIIPSRWEGFGLVAIEAMRFAKPVIASRVGALPEIVVPGETGYLFAAQDIAGLRDIIEGLDSDELKAMGERGYDRFIAHFTSEELNTRLLACYAELVEPIACCA